MRHIDARTRPARRRRPARSPAQESEKKANERPSIPRREQRGEGRRDPAEGKDREADPRPRPEVAAQALARRSARFAGKALATAVGGRAGRPRRYSFGAWRWLCTVVWTLVALLPFPARAGLSLDEALARRARATPGDGTPAPTPIALDAGARDDVTAGRRRARAGTFRRCFARALRGEGGLRLRTRTGRLDGACRGPPRRRLARPAIAPDFVRRELDQRPARRRPHLRLGRAAPLGSVVDRQPDPRRRGASRCRRSAGARTSPTPFQRRRAGLARAVAARRLRRRAVAAQRAAVTPHLFGARFQVDAAARPRARASRGPCSGAAAAATRACESLCASADRPATTSTSIRPTTSPATSWPGSTPATPCRSARAARCRSTARRSARTRPAGGRATTSAASASTRRSRVGAATAGASSSRHADTTMSGAFGTPILGGAYRHRIYPDGYTQRGELLGHPGGGDIAAGRRSAPSSTPAPGRGTRCSMPRRRLHAPRRRWNPAAAAWAASMSRRPGSVDARSRLGLALSHWRDGGREWTRRPAVVAAVAPWR